MWKWNGIKPDDQNENQQSVQKIRNRRRNRTYECWRSKGVANNYDMIFVSETFTSQFRVGKDTKVIGLKNLLSEKEIEAKIREALDMPAE